jgi:hypothetical protein
MIEFGAWSVAVHLAVAGGVTLAAFWYLGFLGFLGLAGFGGFPGSSWISRNSRRLPKPQATVSVLPIKFRSNSQGLGAHGLA